MRVNVVETRTVIYTFTKEEQDYLIKRGMWKFIYTRLLDNERIEVE
jgi:hypothetical protein